MLSSRNIHFAILGIILGATSGYIFAFYQVQSSMPRTLTSTQSGGAPQGHPDVNDEQLQAMVKEALDKNPNDTTLMTRYANFLFDRQRFPEAIEWFRKAIAIEPTNLDYRTDLATALWSAGQKDQAMAEYRQILQIDPKHMATLHNVVIVYLEDRNVAEAERAIRQIEAIDPSYEGLKPLRQRLSELQ
jgi:tetratricopeptide (TPR) repeat protein